MGTNTPPERETNKMRLHRPEKYPHTNRLRKRQKRKLWIGYYILWIKERGVLDTPKEKMEEEWKK